MTAPLLQVEIWSDIQCPFCYLGKRQFEAALEAFEEKDRVEVTWKGESIYAYLARKKGMTEEVSRRMHDQIAQTASKAGLHYRFDQMVVANSHPAHRLIQAAKARGRGDAAEEALFHAYFSEGKNLEDRETLVDLGQSAGLSEAEAAGAFEDPEGVWGRKVDDEAAEAHALGSTGVPFFVFQRQ